MDWIRIENNFHTSDRTGTTENFKASDRTGTIFENFGRIRTGGPQIPELNVEKTEQQIWVTKTTVLLTCDLIWVFRSVDIFDCLKKKLSVHAQWIERIRMGRISCELNRRLWFILTLHTYSTNLPKCITWIKPLNDQSVVWIFFRVSHDTFC